MTPLHTCGTNILVLGTVLYCIGGLEFRSAKVCACTLAAIANALSYSSFSSIDFNVLFFLDSFVSGMAV